jgi:hypothetical protein
MFICLVFFVHTPTMHLRFIRQEGYKNIMKSSKPQNKDEEYEPFLKLIQVMRDDPLINEKVSETLKLDSYHRRTVLNNWLEQLRQQKAPESLRRALSSLLDDAIANEVLRLINNHRIKNNNGKTTNHYT